MSASPSPSPVTYGVLALYVALFVVIGWAWFRIFRKAGYSGWMGLLMIVPVVGFVTMIWFAAARWPSRLRSASGSAPLSVTDGTR